MYVSSTTSITIQELKYSSFAATGKLPEFPFESSSTNFRTHSKKGWGGGGELYQNAIFHLKIFQLKFSCQLQMKTQRAPWEGLGAVNKFPLLFSIIPIYAIDSQKFPKPPERKKTWAEICCFLPSFTSRIFFFQRWFSTLWPVLECGMMVFVRVERSCGCPWMSQVGWGLGFGLWDSGRCSWSTETAGTARIPGQCIHHGTTSSQAPCVPFFSSRVACA